MDNIVIFILLVLVGIVVGALAVIVINNIRGNAISKKSEQILEETRREADKIKRDSILETKEELHKLKIETEKELKEKKLEIKESENRLTQRESNMDKRDLMFQKREEALDEREEKLTNRQNVLNLEQAKIEEIKNEQIKVLQDLSGVSREEAKKLVMDKVRESMNLEITFHHKTYTTSHPSSFRTIF